MTDQTAENMTHRARMLQQAQEHEAALQKQLKDAQKDLLRLREELDKVTAELRSGIASGRAVVTNLKDELEDAQALVKDLTPRAPRTRRPAQTEDVPELTAAEDDTAEPSGVLD